MKSLVPEGGRTVLPPSHVPERFPVPPELPSPAPANPPGCLDVLEGRLSRGVRLGYRAASSQITLGVFLTFLFAAAFGTFAQDQTAVELPAGVRAVWDTARAFRETTPTRERLSLNGLWRWQPAADKAAETPANGWGYFKVPACWPGVVDYLQNDYQTLYAHPGWKSTKLAEVSSAWYERTFSVPAEWAGRRIGLELEYLNSYAAVFIDGQKAGELRFPGGTLDLSAVARPGATHRLTLLVVAMPLKALMESYNDTNTAKQRKGRVERRGLCGDAWLTSEPAAARLAGVRVTTSVRKGETGFEAGVAGLVADGRYRLKARLSEQGHSLAEFAGPVFAGADVKDGHTSFTALWKAPKLWDIHTPTNQYTAEVSLVDAADKVVDTAPPVTFGFREFWIEGRDFYLNGTRLYLSLVPIDNAQVGAALSTYAAARETMLRLKSYGINFVYTHNYGCEPGAHLSFDEILRAADDTGMLVSLSQPHFSAYDWKSADADRTNGYAHHAAFYAKVAASHPSVVCYSMSHNATGYNEDTNPQMMDGTKHPRDQWSDRNVTLALRSEAIVNRLDPSRIVYHHSSGDLSSMYTLNFYLNFVPIQELDDWFEHWSTAGNKPLVLVEYGVPFGWDWTMYRGWYQGKREFGSAAAPWEYCLAEWNAQFLGPVAYHTSPREDRNLRWEAEQFRRGRPGWMRWDYPTPVGDVRFDEMQPVQEAYTTANWRAFRTWGLSGNSPWEHDRFWKLRDGFEPRRRDLPVNWENLQRPGYSPDHIEHTFASFELAYERTDWVPTETAKSLMRNNMPLLGWIAGKPEHFTAKDHVFYPGETFVKQLVLINNSRVTVTCDEEWSAGVPGIGGSKHVVLPTGEQARVELHIDLPASLAPGSYEIKADFKFGTGLVQSDAFTFQVIPRPMPPKPAAKIALFDPPGQTAKWLAGQGVSATPVADNTDLSPYDALLIGKAALTPDGPAPSLKRVRDGLKVVVFEQTSQVLEERLGFKVEEYGLRQVWPRLENSPLLAGLGERDLADWRGTATLLPPTLDYKLNQRYSGAPTVRWCGLDETRLWRCGNWGNVASVLIETPPRGDFLPILDGGYALQYSPLLEYREGKGMVLFCQMDLTGRTESEPAAETLGANLLRYVDAWQPAVRRTPLYAGEVGGREWLAHCGLEAAPFKSGSPAPGQVLILGPGFVKETTGPGAVADWVKAGGRVLALGLDQNEVDSFMPTHVSLGSAEYISASFPGFPAGSPFQGISPADVHNRDPRKLSLVNGGATSYAHGTLANAGSVVFCQLVPWHFAQDPEHFNQRRTFQRVSFAVSRILANLGVSGSPPLLDRFAEPVSGTTGPSVVRNGTFAANRMDASPGAGLPAEWEFNSGAKGASCSRETNATAGGSLAAVISVPPVTDNSKPPEVMLSQLGLPIRKGQWYRFSVMTRAENLSCKNISWTVQNTANWQSLFEYENLAPQPQWRTNTFVLQAKDTVEKGSKLQIWFNGIGKLWLADVRLEPVPAPTEGRWNDGLYLVKPTDWDDPYRFFGW